MSEDMSQGPEPGTREWLLETGNYIDPEPDWDAGPPYIGHARGIMYWDTASEADAGRERYPGCRHRGPEPEIEAGTARDDPGPGASGYDSRPGGRAVTATGPPPPAGRHRRVLRRRARSRARSGLPGSVRPDGTPGAIAGLPAALRPRFAAGTSQRKPDSEVAG